MMTTETDPTMWKWIVEHMWMPLSAAIGAVWAMLNSRISAVEKKADEAVQKSEFREYIARDEIAHEQLRQSVIKIFDKFDELKDLIVSNKRRR